MNIKEITQQAIDKFGEVKQVAVAMEELCELSSAIAKFVRYDDTNKAVESTKEKVLDEYCDVIIVMNTIANIYGFTEKNIKTHLNAKAERVSRWVNSNDETLEVTTKDRAVIEEKPCETCDRYINPDYLTCTMCQKAQATEGLKPFYKKKD